MIVSATLALKKRESANNRYMMRYAEMCYKMEFCLFINFLWQNAELVTKMKLVTKIFFFFCFEFQENEPHAGTSSEASKDATQT